MPSIDIDATDGSGAFKAFLASPSGSGPHGAILLIQEIFGVNEAMREAARLFADQGYAVLVPDLFWRIQPGVELTDQSEAEWKQAFALMEAFDQAKGVEDLQATLATVRRLPGCNGRAGTVGYCLGGRLAMMMALRSDAEVNVSYYGVGLEGLVDDLSTLRAPLLLHIAELDAFVPPPSRARIVDSVSKTSLAHAHVYPGADHAFARPGGQNWQGRAATIANGRTAEALADALG